MYDYQMPRTMPITSYQMMQQQLQVFQQRFQHQVVLGETKIDSQEAENQHHHHQQQPQHITQRPRHETSPSSSSSSSSKRSTSTKSKRVRTIFTPDQLKRLEQEFSNQMYLVGSDRGCLASSLNLTEAQVKVWFQNRRIKQRKLSSTLPTTMARDI